MNKIYLFDWGDTLMVDFPDQKGKMCDWDEVQAVNGAHEILENLSREHLIYVATNAVDSSENDIKLAFERVGLAQFLAGYFCKANLGLGKGSPEFFHKVAQELSVSHDSLIMVGDSLDNDILRAINAGVSAVWFNPKFELNDSVVRVNQINKLCEICT
ncbi:HAD hydrolase-like protein [bacterium 19MO04SH03]|uniref:HAD hydrolase-like protein n=2 Tax=Unclassified Bacteria TaxID=49928 RepID=A0AAU6UXJ1_UNCXX